MQEETLEGAGHAGSGGGKLAPLGGLWELERITQTAPVDHTAAWFPPIFSNFLWSPPFPSPHTMCRAMVLMGFYVCSALHVGTEPWEPIQSFNPAGGAWPLLPPPTTCPGHTHTQPGAAGRSHQHPGLRTFPPFGKLKGIHKHKKPSYAPTPGRTGQTLASLEQNEEETNTDLFCL